MTTERIIKDISKLKTLLDKLKSQNKKIVFTNGCFDILHAGHVDYLNKAKDCGDFLVVAINTDLSVRRIKGDKRPIVNEDERAYILSNLKAVDFVTFFDDETPKEVIETLLPDVLVKGADWAIDKIVGKDAVEAAGGKVERIEFITHTSTTNIINKVIETYKD